MFQNPKVTNEIMMLQNIPEVIRIINSIFFGSDKLQAIAYEVLCLKISQSFRTSFSEKQADQHLQYLLEADFSKDWIKIVQLNEKKYIRVSEGHQLKDLFAAAIQRIAQLRKN